MIPSTDRCPLDHDKLQSMVDESLEQEQHCALVVVLARYSGVFDITRKHRCSSIPPTRTHHFIHTGAALPIRQKPFHVSPSERRVIYEQVQQMLQNGTIQESSSGGAAPVILVKKKDGSRLFCVYYRRLNELQKKTSIHFHA